MRIQRKLQLGAAIVMANGLAVLSMMAPSTAVAGCNQYRLFCDTCFYDAAICDTWGPLPPGCTSAVSAQCTNGLPCGVTGFSTLCSYQ